MEWKKAKNYVIIFLVLVNCLFFGLNLMRRSETRLSSRDVKAVTSVLKDRGITLNCQLPVSFDDMIPLYMRPYEYDNLVLQEIFFGGISGVIRTESEGNVIFSGDKGKLTVSGDNVRFEGSLEAKPQSRQEAEAAAESYVYKLNGRFTDYREPVTGETQEGWRISYRQSFHNRLVFSNYLTAQVNRDGAIEIVFNYQQPVEYKGGRERIISADEAVYAASKAICEDYVATTVDGVEKGYYLTERHGGSGAKLAAVPQYKVYVDGGARAYYVNAYSGDVMRE